MGPLSGLLSTMVGSISLILMLVAGGLVYALLVRAERAGRPERAVGLVLALLLVELLLYPSQNDVSGLPFRLSVLGQSFRLVQVVIIVALAARLSVRGVPSRATLPGLAWGVFLVWWVTSFVVGLLHGNALDLAVFHLNMVLYVGGTMVLAAGVPVARYVDRRSMGRWSVGLGLVLVACLGPTLTITPLFVDPPFAPGAQAGIVSADLATVLVGIAVVVLLVENAQRLHRRVLVSLAAVLMLAYPLFQGQRGALLGLGTAAALLVGVAATSVWRRRIATTYTEAALFGALVLVPFLGNVIWTATDPGRLPEPEVPPAIVDSVEDSFSAPAKQQSAETRRNLWRDGVERVGDRPYVGSGLGTEYRVKRAAVAEDLVGGGFHNVLLDVLVRTGAVGFALFGVAVAATVGAGLGLWRRHVDHRVAALSMGVMIALANVAAKSMVESVFEKYRLAVFIGLLLGVLLSAVSSTRDDDRVSSLPKALDHDQRPVGV
jgi:O-antigen ligase